mmetsp:Transcript_8703/g.17661  ORF Transcript_8703/g.17661 Transcript_8703/m.17661 type:complete len:81 (+) Transcript_8703:699-941(+)
MECAREGFLCHQILVPCKQGMGLALTEVVFLELAKFCMSLSSHQILEFFFGFYASNDNLLPSMKRRIIMIDSDAISHVLD